MTQIKALVTGCYGQDGSLICRSLLQKGIKVIGVSRSKSKKNQNHIELGIESDIHIIEADISNFNAVKKIFKQENVDEIYNLAGQSSVGNSFHEPIRTIESIVNGTLNILEVARQVSYGGKLFFAGSSEIFGNTEKPADISHIQRPCSPYAVAKQCGFNLVKMYRELYQIKCSTGILFNHESPLRDESFITQKIITGAIKCLSDKNHKITIGNVDVFRDWGWAEEYVEAMQLIINSRNTKDYVICTGTLNSLERFIEIVFQKLNLNYQDHIISNKSLFRKTDIHKSYGDPKTMSNDLGWKAKYQIEDIIEKLIDTKLKKLSVN